MVLVMHMFVASEHAKQQKTVGTFNVTRVSSDQKLPQSIAIRRPQYPWCRSLSTTYRCNTVPDAHVHKNRSWGLEINEH